MAKRQRHKKSILETQKGRCFLCARQGDDSLKYTEEHHIFGGPRRRISEAEGLKVYLCPGHHRTSAAAAHRNMETMRLLQAAAQEAWEAQHSHEEWMLMMGKNYL